jgi:hypothetical protein
VRISPTEALQLLLPAYKAPDAAAALTEAAYRNRCRLWCNDGLLGADYIATALKIVARPEADGRWRAEVVSTAREAWEHPPDHYRFELDEAEVRTLLPEQKPRKKPGRKPTANWPDRIYRELRRIGRKRARELENFGQLRSDLEDFLDRIARWHPADPRRLRALIRDFLNGKIN